MNAGIYPSREDRAATASGSLYYRIAGTVGDLPDVVLEAGGMCTLNIWSQIEQVLAPHTRLLSYDRAGLGKSPADGLGCSAAAVSRRLEALVETTQVRRPFVMVGYSLGGPYIRYYAAQHPQQVAALVLLDATPSEYSIPPSKLRLAIAINGALHWAARLGLGRLLWRVLVKKGDPAEMRETLDWLASPAYMNSLRDELGGIEGIKAEIASTAAVLRHPTLSLIAGIGKHIPEKDWADIRGMHDRLAASAPAPLSQFAVIDAADHSTMVSHPVNGKDVGERILAFLRSLPR